MTTEARADPISAPVKIDVSKASPDTTLSPATGGQAVSKKPSQRRPRGPSRNSSAKKVASAKTSPAENTATAESTSPGATQATPAAGSAEAEPATKKSSRNGNRRKQGGASKSAAAGKEDSQLGGDQPIEAVTGSSDKQQQKSDKSSTPHNENATSQPQNKRQNSNKNSLNVPKPSSTNGSSAASSVVDSTRPSKNRKRGANNQNKDKPVQPTTVQRGNKLQAIVSPPRDAMDIAKSTPRNPTRDRDVGLGTVSSLQQKIDELKTLPPAPVNTTGLRKSSLTLNSDIAASSPLAIPGAGQHTASASRSSFSSGSQGRLKADAPVFQPSNSPVSPSAMVAPDTAGSDSAFGRGAQRQTSGGSAARLSFSGSRRASNPLEQLAGVDE